jgi:putative protein-disulfide isomerase
MKTIAEEYKEYAYVEVLSGGMMPLQYAKPVSVIASYVSKSYKRVEELTGVKFGEDYLWHMFNPEKSDWVPHSEKSAIALCIFKELQPSRQLEFASDMQYALNYEGRDLTDDEAYRHLLGKYTIDPEDFYRKLHSDEYREKARYEFALCGQLQVTAFPVVLLQTGETKFYLVAKGFTYIEDMRGRLDRILNENQVSEESKE